MGALTGNLKILARQIARRQGDLRFVACTSKVRYGSESAARRALKKMKTQRHCYRKDTLRVYRCGYCPYFHLGHE